MDTLAVFIILFTLFLLNFIISSLTVNEIMEIIQNEDSKSLIYVTPPDDGLETDEDSDQSDDEHMGNLDNLGRKMLLSRAELQKVRNDDKENYIVDESISECSSTTAATNFVEMKNI